VSPSPLQIISLTRLKGRNNPFQPLAVILYLPSPIIPYFAWGRYLGSTGIEGKYGVVDNKCWEMGVLRRGGTEKKKKQGTWLVEFLFNSAYSVLVRTRMDQVASVY